MLACALPALAAAPKVDQQAFARVIVEEYTILLERRASMQDVDVSGKGDEEFRRLDREQAKDIRTHFLPEIAAGRFEIELQPAGLIAVTTADRRVALRAPNSDWDAEYRAIVKLRCDGNAYAEDLIERAERLQGVRFDQGFQLVDVARQSRVTAISEGTYMGHTQFARHAIDNDPKTSWASQFDMPAWLQLDLTSQQHVAAIVIVWGEGTHNQQFSIAISNDGRTWKTVVSSRWSPTDALDYAGRYDNGYHGNTKVVRDFFHIEPTMARYIRVNVEKTQAPSSHIFQAILHGVEVYARKQE